eukprot:SAG25_NODE_53_length_18703_cov_126.779104_10_plen_497_part_00
MAVGGGGATATDKPVVRWYWHSTRDWVAYPDQQQDEVEELHGVYMRMNRRARAVSKLISVGPGGEQTPVPGREDWTGALLLTTQGGDYQFDFGKMKQYNKYGDPTACRAIRRSIEAVRGAHLKSQASSSRSTVPPKKQSREGGQSGGRLASSWTPSGASSRHGRQPGGNAKKAGEEPTDMSTFQLRTLPAHVERYSDVKAEMVHMFQMADNNPVRHAPHVAVYLRVCPLSSRRSLRAGALVPEPHAWVVATAQLNPQGQAAAVRQSSSAATTTAAALPLSEQLRHLRHSVRQTRLYKVAVSQAAASQTNVPDFDPVKNFTVAQLSGQGLHGQVAAGVPLLPMPPGEPAPAPPPSQGGALRFPPLQRQRQQTQSARLPPRDQRWATAAEPGQAVRAYSSRERTGRASSGVRKQPPSWSRTPRVGSERPPTVTLPPSATGEILMSSRSGKIVRTAASQPASQPTRSFAIPGGSAVCSPRDCSADGRSLAGRRPLTELT